MAGLLAAATAIPLAWFAHMVGGFPAVLALTLLLAVMGRRGWWHLDRVMGQMIALWALSGGLWFAGVEAHIFPYPGWVGAFVICQGLMLWAPRPVRWGAAKSRLGDDIVAGGITALIITASAAVSHGWLA